MRFIPCRSCCFGLIGCCTRVARCRFFGAIVLFLLPLAGSRCGALWLREATSSIPALMDGIGRMRDGARPAVHRARAPVASPLFAGRRALRARAVAGLHERGPPCLQPWCGGGEVCVAGHPQSLQPCWWSAPGRSATASTSLRGTSLFFRALVGVDMRAQHYIRPAQGTEPVFTCKPATLCCGRACRHEHMLRRNGRLAFLLWRAWGWM